MKHNAASSVQLLRQFFFEINSWGRLLAFQTEELVYFKYRLAEITPAVEDEADLLALETYQEQFLTQEKTIAYLKSELRSQNKLLEKDLYIDGMLLQTVIKNQKKLRHEMRVADELFSDMKKKFVQFLIERY